MMHRFPYVMSILLLLFVANTLRAGFVATSLDLTDSVTDTSAGSAVVDFDSITTISNPLDQDSLAQVGMNIVESTYAFQWNETAGTGEFNTDLSHAIRSLSISTVTRVQVFIEPTEDLRVTVAGSLTYAHTPSRGFRVVFGMAIRDFSTSDDVFFERREGGNGLNDPASGTLAFMGEAILQAGTLYRLQAVLDNTNTGEPNIGDLDATGYADFHVAPLIPEPASALLLIIGITASGTQRRRRIP